MEEVYRQLAERNGWSYSTDDGRPYFMKDGKYAVPDETTSEEDKLLLAEIISEGSEEMMQLILLCWENGITISGPCSGIREFHDETPFYLHFTFITTRDTIEPLYEALQKTFPGLEEEEEEEDLDKKIPFFSHLCREKDGLIRYDFSYILKGKNVTAELTSEESDEIFATIREKLQITLDKSNNKKR